MTKLLGYGSALYFYGPMLQCMEKLHCCDSVLLSYGWMLCIMVNVRQYGQCLSLMTKLIGYRPTLYLYTPMLYYMEKLHHYDSYFLFIAECYVLWSTLSKMNNVSH